MQFIIAGFLQSSYMREMQKHMRGAMSPEGLDYYRELQRFHSEGMFGRAATFISIAEETHTGHVDWNISDSEEFDINNSMFGLVSNQYEVPNDIGDFVRFFLLSNALKPDTLSEISSIRSPDGIVMPSRKLKGHDDSAHVAAYHYLLRLLIAVFISGEYKLLLVISEIDLRVIREIGAFISETKAPTPIELPDLHLNDTVSAENFAGGLLNFSPADALSVAKVRSDRQIKAYAEHVRSIITSASPVEREAALVDAMRKAMQQKDLAARAQKVFEVESWAAKGLKYTPVVGTAVSLLNDFKDLLNVWVKRKRRESEWYLIAAKMQDISTSDYLSRKDNFRAGK